MKHALAVFVGSSCLACLAWSGASAQAPTPAPTDPAARERTGSTSVAAKPMARGEQIAPSTRNAAALEAFRSGRELFDNLRAVEAAQQLRKAVEADPNFALAHAYLGLALPGAEGMRHIEKATSLAPKASEPERLFIEAAAAQRRADPGKAIDAARKLARVAPNDWRAQLLLGQTLLFTNAEKEAIPHLEKATRLNPQAGPAFNMLGYANLNLDRTDEAIKAFQKYAQVDPSEPNPHDSLGEALLKAGRFKEAEAAFKKAVAAEPSFWIAHAGIAQSRFLRGDSEGGVKALAAARDAAPTPAIALQAEGMTAWSQAGQGNVERALEINKDALGRTSSGDLAVFRAPVLANRAWLLVSAGRHDEALKAATDALAAAQQPNVPGDVAHSARALALGAQIEAETGLGRMDAAQKTLGAIDEFARKVPADPQAQNLAHLGRGVTALAQKNARAAVDHLSKCDKNDSYCRMRLADAQQLAGDTAAAQRVRQELLSANARDPFYLWVRSELKAEPPMTTGSSR